MLERYKLYTWSLFTCLWIQLCYGFFQSEVIPALTKVQPYVFLLTDLVFIALGLRLIRKRNDVVMFGVFMLIAILSSLLNHGGVVQFVNGFRSFAGLLFATPIIRYFITSKDGERFVKSFDRQIYIFLWLQVPTMIIEFVRNGAGDSGGGTYGLGGSGMISTLICILSYYLMRKRWNEEYSYGRNLKENWTLIFLLFPTFLNETKVSLILLPFYFLLLMRVDRAFALRVFMASPIIAVMMLAAGFAYIKITGQDQNEVLSVDFFNQYLVGEDLEQLAYLSVLVDNGDIETDDLWVVDLPRFGKLILVPEALTTTRGGMMFGAGIGQFKGRSVLKMSEFRRKYNWLLNGSVPMAFFILIELGFVGMAWLTACVITMLLQNTTNSRWTGMRMLLGLVFVLTMLYNDQMTVFSWMFLYSYLALAPCQLSKELLEDGQS